MHLSELFRIQTALETMLFYLNEDDHKKLRCTDKGAENFYSALSTSHQWSLFLKFKNRKTHMISSAAKKYFTDKPSRRSDYMFYDVKGASYILKKIIRNKEKLNYKILNRERIAIFLYQGLLTLSLLKRFQQHHFTALNLKIPLHIITSPTFTKIHLAAMHTFNYSYDDIKKLNSVQIRGLCSGFSTEDIHAKWFTSHHIKAIKNGLQHRDIHGKSAIEVNKTLREMRINQRRGLASP